MADSPKEGEAAQALFCAIVDLKGAAFPSNIPNYLEFKQKYKIVISHPISINEYLTSKGDTKKPNDPAQVTMPVAIVLLDDGKCFATTETGMLIAVPPNPIPIKSPIVSVKK